MPNKQKQMNVRLDELVHEQLRLLSKSNDTPMNDLVVEAIERFLSPERARLREEIRKEHEELAKRLERFDESYRGELDFLYGKEELEKQGKR